MPFAKKLVLRRLAPLLVLASMASGCFALTSSQSSTLNAMNNDRVANGLGRLPVEVYAQQKAQAWANKLASEDTLYHSNLPDGINTQWCSLGENIGYGPSISTIETAYMNSPGHRANILSTKWNGAGVGVARHGDRVFTVEEFIKTC